MRKALLVLVLTGALTAVPSAAHAATVGSLPPDPTTKDTANRDIEPGMAAAPDGSLWVTAMTGVDDPRRGLGGALPRQQDPLEYQGNADVWVSRDGGRSYRWVAAPFGALPGRPGLGGDDVDIAAATARNASGHYNIYLATLWLAGFEGSNYVGDMSLAMSPDGGRHWLVDPVAATIPMDDRPWVAADGACTAYVAYHALPTATLTVQRYDFCNLGNSLGGATTGAINSTRLVSFAPDLATGKAGTYVLASYGKPIVDTRPGSPHRHRIYLPAVDCPPQTLSQDVPRASAPVQQCAGPASEVYLLTSDDEGAHWALHQVAEGPDNRITLWAPTIAIDQAGTLYLTWFDHHAAYLVSSNDGGATWTPRHQIDTGPAGSVAFPTITARAPGDVRIALYGTDRPGDPEDTAVMGNPGAPGAAVWSIYEMHSANGGQTFTRPQPLAAVHTGTVCVNGDRDTPICDLFSPSRSIFETLAVGISPLSSATAIAYTSDLPGGGHEHDHTDYAAVG